MCKTQLGDDYLAKLPEEPFFVDFLREAPEPTGEEAEDAVLEAPKIYEVVIYILFNIGFMLCTSNQNIQLNVTDIYIGLELAIVH